MSQQLLSNLGEAMLQVQKDSSSIIIIPTCVSIHLGQAK